MSPLLSLLFPSGDGSMCQAALRTTTSTSTTGRFRARLSCTRFGSYAAHDASYWPATCLCVQAVGPASLSSSEATSKTDRTKTASCASRRTEREYIICYAGRGAVFDARQAHRILRLVCSFGTRSRARSQKVRRANYSLSLLFLYRNWKFNLYIYK